MLRIELQNIGKKYNKQWLFRNINANIEPNQMIALTGNNGSGKSTLLQMIYQYVTCSEGEIKYWLNEQEIAADKINQLVSLAAPYMEIPEILTLNELIDFHFSIQNKMNGVDINEWIEKGGLKNHVNKSIRNYSSGMKQRVKLLLSILTDRPLLLLDEPCTNFDELGIVWYQSLLKEVLGKRSIIIASNQPEEYLNAMKIFKISGESLQAEFEN